MRIISGRFRGKKLRPPSNLTLRPTTDFAKESLFNLLQNKIELEGIHFLDLFAGTGNISYELISRGAGSGFCVDISLASHKFRQRMIKELDCRELKSIKTEAFRFVRNMDDRFDFIFADPPYDMEDLPKLPQAIFTSGLLKPDGLMVIEHPENHTFDDSEGFVEQRNYGRVNFSFFTLNSEE